MEEESSTADGTVIVVSYDRPPFFISRLRTNCRNSGDGEFRIYRGDYLATIRTCEEKERQVSGDRQAARYQKSWKHNKQTQIKSSLCKQRAVVHTYIQYPDGKAIPVPKATKPL